MTNKKQPQPIIIPEDDFFEQYKPIINHIARANADDNTEDEDIAPWSGAMYETFSPEVDHIVALANNAKTRNKVWTIVEGDDGNTIILAGYHLVNRQGYLITEKPWLTGSEEVPIDTEVDG